VWKKLDEVPTGEATLPWLYGVAYRVVSHQWRSAARGKRLIDRLAELAVVELPTPDLVLLRREEDRLVLEAASRLRPVDQEILRLTLWEGLSHADVAKVLDVAPSVIKQRAYRARHALAVEFQKPNRNTNPRCSERRCGMTVEDQITVMFARQPGADLICS
jgi:RNA polymerase sigma-70 factor (ECF subfamily)